MDSYEFTYQGTILSTNQAKSLHWRALKKKVDALKFQFKEMVRNSDIPPMDQIAVEVRYWSRHDVDNVTFSVKAFVDILVHNGRLPDDNKKHWRKLTITVDQTLKLNTLIIKIIPVDGKITN